MPSREQSHEFKIIDLRNIFFLTHYTHAKLNDLEDFTMHTVIILRLCSASNRNNNYMINYI